MRKFIALAAAALLVASPALFAADPTASPPSPDNTVQTSPPIAGPSIADDERAVRLDTPQTSPSAGASGSVGAFIRAIVALLVVAGLVYAFVYFLKRASGRAGTAESEIITVLGSRTIRGAAGVHVVEIAGKVYILGSGDAVSLIAEVTDSDAIDDLRFRARNRPVASGFSRILADKLHIKGLKLNRPDLGDMLDKQKDRLKKL